MYGGTTSGEGGNAATGSMEDENVSSGDARDEEYGQVARSQTQAAGAHCVSGSNLFKGAPNTPVLALLLCFEGLL